MLWVFVKNDYLTDNGIQDVMREVRPRQGD